MKMGVVLKLIGQNALSLMWFRRKFLDETLYGPTSLDLMF